MVYFVLHLKGNLITCLSTCIFAWKESSWSWSYCSWIYNYLCSQYLSPLKLRVWTPFMARSLDITRCDKVCQWPAICWWFSQVSSTNENWPPLYNWHIVESGVKHYKPKQWSSTIPQISTKRIATSVCVWFTHLYSPLGYR